MDDTDSIVERLRRDGHRLSQQVLDEQYRDPFWTERYGARGRRHADEDSDFHLRYLIRALQHGDPGVMVRYARWLREVLASRGMCTRHLAENFRHLAAALESMRWPGGDAAVVMVRQAEAALAYEEAAPRAVQEAAASVAREVERAHRERFPRGWAHADGREDPLREDLLNFLSYVADSLAFDSPATLVSHTAWFAGHLERSGTPRAELDAAIRFMMEAVERHSLPAAARSHLETALAAPTGAAALEVSWKTTPPHETRSTS